MMLFVSCLVCRVEIQHYYLVADDAWLGTEERNVQWLVSAHAVLCVATVFLQGKVVEWSYNDVRW